MGRRDPRRSRGAPTRRWRARAGWHEDRDALLVVIGAVVVAALAFVPVVGYVEALALPALGMRLRRRAGKRYAGLRTLARD